MHYDKYFNFIKVILVNLLILAVLLTLTEIALRMIRPTSLGTMGHSASPNGQLYGWGYYSGEIIYILDPDTGEVFSSPANSHGWRDAEHQYQNSKGAFRILLLGDSNTFGDIVSVENTYPRILEKLLRSRGLNVEVISIAYAGWGTDQELEALINEGVKYKPNLIIVQFCTNDLTDNDYYRLAQKDPLHKYLGWKPFYYTLEAGVLVRHINPFFEVEKPAHFSSIKELLWSVLGRLELPRLFYFGYRALKLREDPIPNKQTGNSVAAATQFTISNNQLRMLELNTDIDPDGSFYRFLKTRINETISRDELIKRLEQSEVKDYSNVVLRILEKRAFHEDWSDASWLAKHQDGNSYQWQLFKALVQQMKDASDKIGARLLIFPETDLGQFKWQLAWYRTKNNEQNKTEWLSHLQVIQDLMNQIGVQVIQPKREYLRARNDSHPNAEGNEAMAEDIMDYVLRTEGSRFTHRANLR